MKKLNNSKQTKQSSNRFSRLLKFIASSKKVKKNRYFPARENFTNNKDFSMNRAVSTLQVLNKFSSKQPFNKHTKFLNNTLLKELIDVDFPYIKASWKETKIASVDLSIKVHKYDYYNILNLYLLNTNMKQFIRILQFLTNSNKFKIYFWSTNEYMLELIQMFVKEYKLENIIIPTRLFPHYKVELRDTMKFLFILGYPWLGKIGHDVRHKICSENYILVNHYDFSFNRDSYGMYQIQNDLLDYKKIFVLLTIINMIIKPKKDN